MNEPKRIAQARYPQYYGNGQSSSVVCGNHVLFLMQLERLFRAKVSHIRTRYGAGWTGTWMDRQTGIHTHTISYVNKTGLLTRYKKQDRAAGEDRALTDRSLS